MTELLRQAIAQIEKLPIDSPKEQLNRRKRRLMGERNFVECVGLSLAQPNLQILALSQFQLSSLEETFCPVPKKPTLVRGLR